METHQISTLVASHEALARRTDKPTTTDDEISLYCLGMESSSEGIAIFTLPDLTLIKWNPTFANLIGRHAEDILGLHPWDWDTKLTKANFQQTLSEIFPVSVTTAFTQFETTFRRADGTLIDVLVSASEFLAGASNYAYTVSRDITNLKIAERALKESESKFRAFFNSARRLIGVLAPDGRNIETNPVGYAFTGLTPEQAGELYFWEGHCWPSDEERNKIRDAVKRAAAGEYVKFEASQRGPDGAFYVSDFSISPILDDAGKVILLMSEANDITALKRAEAELIQREQEIRSLVDHSPDGICRYDRSLRRIFINSAMRKFMGKPIEPYIGKTLDEMPALSSLGEFKQRLQDVFEIGRSDDLELPFCLPNGASRWAQARFSPEFNGCGEVEFVLAIMRDITELVENRQRIHELAYADSLTGLPNRAYFTEQFQEIIETAAAKQWPAGLLMIDLDHFKNVNDTLGHAAGDELLNRVTQRLKRVIRDTDLLARLGGDEFAVILETPDQAEIIAQRLLDVLQAPFKIFGQELFISASIGIAKFPQDGESTQTLLSHADAAMYHAKRSGRCSFRAFTKELTAESARRLALASALHFACANGELELYFQPKIGLSQRNLVGAEALLRWNHPEFGIVMPDVFIPIAEETGLIVEIGRWVLRNACEFAANWNENQPGPIAVAVNLSSRQFVQNDLVADIRDALVSSGCEKQWLECEITESLILHNEPSVQQTLAAISAMGISLAIDDFGKGHSALSYLNQFDIDVLKIDRSFIDGMEHDPRKTELVRAFVSMASALDMHTVAEGVETEEQVQLLRLVGCQIAQGYLFGKPMPAAEFERFAAPIASDPRVVVRMTAAA